MRDLVHELEVALEPHGFHRIPGDRAGTLCRAIFRRQTINLNRAVALVYVDVLPTHPTLLLRKIKKEVAYSCGFFPFFYGIGIQLVLVTADPATREMEALKYVDKYDNQWSIIQSIFVLGADFKLIAQARSWGQFLTGRYQDTVAKTLSCVQEG